jgi:DNA-binding NarL/FixJ family response regulator
MASTARARQARRGKRRRIIERPRLFALLDESPARVRTLVAAAGYGKTTLAHQWVRRDERRSAWYTARRASTDVAALALGVARATAAIFPGCDARLREHLRAVPNPGEHVDVLADILGEELADWTASDWLVVDEYNELAASADAEQFVAQLVASCPIQVLIASRQRPSWISGRSILYGQVLELNQTALAMDTTEAAEVLAQSSRSPSGLVALANGWPAVIALAAVSSAELEADVEVPESLYRFFAEEVFDSLGESVREGLATLAVSPVLDRELAAELLGDDRAEEVCFAALDVGILEERDEHLELHPLARSFLEEWSAPQPGEPERVAAAAATCLRRFEARRDWDAAFDVIARRGPSTELEGLIGLALDELLETARLPTIESWCDFAADADETHPLFDLARAEVALRHGRHAEAQSFAEAAASAGAPELTFRGLSVAGRAAHLASREEDGLELFRSAEAAATSESERRDALWGQLLCATELELPQAGEILDQLRKGVTIADSREVVTAAAHGLAYQLKFGESLDLSDAEVASELVDAIADALVRTSFRNAYSHVLALNANYPEALSMAEVLLEDARAYRIDFAVPYALCSAAVASAGLRKWTSAHSRLDDALSAARSVRNAHAEQLCYALRVRILTQQGKVRTALALEVPTFRRSIAAIRAEALSSRALALATAGRAADAADVVAGLRGATAALEPNVLMCAVDAVVSLKSRARTAAAHVRRLEEGAFESGAIDLLVTTYRASPEFLAMVLRRSADLDRLGALIRRVGDDDLARAVGYPVALSDDDRRQRLSRREREVFELLRSGLTNQQIAASLFISEATVKLHVHHIYDKLETRSRTALTIEAALEHARHATSATDGESNDARSSS